MKILISEFALLSLNAPTLPAIEVQVDGGTRWLVWCKYCLVHHVHGSQEGHREAHCVIDTPYSKLGYNLALNDELRSVVADDNEEK